MNTSTNLNQSASIVKDEAKVTRQRARLERRRMRIMRQKIPSPPPPPPPHRPLPLYLLRHIRSLTSDEVLVYAKKEMENISSVLNDPDPDLYAPLFRNVSIFDNTSKQSSRVKRLMQSLCLCVCSIFMFCNLNLFCFFGNEMKFKVLLRDPLDDNVIPIVEELQRRLPPVIAISQDQGEDEEQQGAKDDVESALEVALEGICSFLDARTRELETAAYPTLDELTSKPSFFFT
ncbi:Magnesium transporter MRS2-2 [Camellia lanceoleosa]|uniref:Magnesium transporter MRS2-2 n=1 Tax=Camellia lanceoleosa TaxID=1840588 RepID=A0ACC0FQ23_9ERIC|nr:Magnesium transporter MRS2-2 [Camellia lanceoleosa]